MPEQAAEALYTRARRQGNKGLLPSILSRGSNALLDLRDISGGVTSRMPHAPHASRVPFAS